MSMKHTPGPWHVSIWGGEFSRGVIETIAEPVAEICHIAKFEVATAGPTVQANARLIAAAPELLAALERFAKGDYGVESVRIARAAMAKARGES